MERLLFKFLVDSNYIHIDYKDLKLQLLAHPDYPSLKAVTDTLDYFEIENLAASIPKEYLGELPDNFMTLIDIEDQGKQLVLVSKKASNNKITYYDQDKGKKKINTEDFLARWDPTIVALEPNVEKVKKSNVTNIPKLQVLSFIIAGLAITSFLISNFHWIPVLYFSLTLAGSFVAYLIAKEDLGLNSASVSKFCNKYANTSCSDVISSSGSKLFKTISLSDASLSFSASLLIFLIFVGFKNNFLFALGALSIPVIAYSVYYQWRVLKKWCLLCLGIAGSIVAQFIVTSIQFDSFAINPVEILYYALIFSGVFFSWSLLKPILKTNHELSATQLDFMKFKRNYNIFTALLSKQQTNKMAPLAEHKQLLRFGNPNASLKITAVTNPLCGYCKASFDTYMKILEHNSNMLSLNFVFNINPKATENPSTQIAHRLMELYHKEGIESSMNAMKNWFSHRDIKIWKKEFGVSDHDNYIETLNFQSEWCRENNINYTPATIIMNRIFPKEFNVEDLKYFINDLVVDLSEEKSEIKDQLY